MAGQNKKYSLPILFNRRLSHIFREAMFQKGIRLVKCDVALRIEAFVISPSSIWKNDTNCNFCSKGPDCWLSEWDHWYKIHFLSTYLYPVISYIGTQINQKGPPIDPPWTPINFSTFPLKGSLTNPQMTSPLFRTF